ncbi:MAG: SLBB domain-containing protein [Geobacteraceae bacterium]|nr:SLBB domain-containing protein [Geobacteraceae bacterium]
MKKLLQILLIVVPLMVSVNAYAASAENQYKTGEREETNLESSRSATKSAGIEGESDDQLRLLLGRQGEGAAKSALEEKAKRLLEEKEVLPLQAEPGKGQLALQVEQGDSFVLLKWRTTGFRQKPGDPPLRYTVSYGAESGKYDKRFEVGNATEYRLRSLNNHQVYFVKVQGQSKDKMITISSDEARAIPLPEEELTSPLERSFSGAAVTLQDRKERIETDPFKRELRQFGYEFFRNSLSRDLSTDNLPVGSDYIIGPGDSLRIHMWGSVNEHKELEVDRNGEITLPRVGVVKIWGLNYGQAKEAINRAISRYFKGYELNVTLGRLRTIQVYVVGEVEAPGTYHVISIGTVLNALSAAGGPSKNGSLRTIKLLKGGKVVQEIDLYDMFLSGDRSKDVRLENGDTIFVPVLGPVAAAAGEVKRPAIYELKGKTTLPQLLAMAGGITAAGYTGRIQLERFEENSARIMVDHEAKSPPLLDEAMAGVELHDRDMVKVFPVNKAIRQVVSLRGNVTRPGEYQFKTGMLVTDLIPGYGALLPDSWLESAEISRLVPPDFHREVLTINLKKAFAGDQRENILLQEQDALQVFSRGEKEEKRFVAINGQVVEPGVFDYYPNMTVRDLVTLAGSPKWNAFLDNAELTRIVVAEGNAKSTRISINLGKALAGEPEDNLVLHPNDVLIVRGVTDWLETKERFVILKGEVRFPGTYSITKGERLSSVIERAGGFTDKAYLKGAKFTRVSVQENQQKRMDEVIAKSEQDILKREAELASLAASREELEATKASLEGLMKSLEKLKAARAEGRVVIRLATLDQFSRTPYDIEMMGGDTLEIPQTPNVVNVMGQVYNTTTLIHMPDKSLSYYLQKAGGPTRDAAESEMYMIKADGTVMSREQATLGFRWDGDGKRWTFGGFMSASPDPGDTLVVPQKMERIAWMREIKDITTILSQVALTAGVIVAAGL